MEKCTAINTEEDTLIEKLRKFDYETKKEIEKYIDFLNLKQKVDKVEMILSTLISHAY
ncbi:hypothetical protein [Clostridium botulinum]|uniref:hypothetical protein n=1 Tax=Clostridium botulinum TaxID=1491 RepID=UPI000174E468|nr:hypothetical protein [Clostridium botulinum]ACD52393.1 hypothetical protein CLH_1760 [Clostridium botulinum E3 str. Alaska E43]MBY6949115.1 hypothetical protein [Clostridium botulinum]MBY7022765.1 hypothetical protein [Clostridium botulinum]MCR1159485.1 hypothetical protein [Clostridium botulinum]